MNGDGKNDAMFSVQEAAGRLRVSASLVYALCGCRLLRHVRIGTGRGTIRIPEDAIADYLKQQTVGAGVAPTAEILTHIRHG